jgi:hypothetical protein
MALPEALTIGNKRAYDNHTSFAYVLVHGMYVCDSQTPDSGQDGEILVLSLTRPPTDGWFEAKLGKMLAHVFFPRQACFRTQAEFWKPGWHEWQVNKSACKEDQPPEPEWDLDWKLHCETKVLR